MDFESELKELKDLYSKGIYDRNNRMEAWPSTVNACVEPIFKEIQSLMRDIASFEIDKFGQAGLSGIQLSFSNHDYSRELILCGAQLAFVQEYQGNISAYFLPWEIIKLGPSQNQIFHRYGKRIAVYYSPKEITQSTSRQGFQLF